MKALSGQLLQNESLANYNTWRVGGVAHYVYRPLDLNDLAEFMKTIPHNEKLLWLGLGSNVLIRDGGFPGVVIVTQGRLKGLSQIDEISIRAEAGVSCAQVARFCARLGLEGQEFLAGVPGTIGGALAMNAGCYGSETWTFVKNVEVLDRKGQLKVKTPNDFSIAYRTVGRLEDEWFVAATFQFRQGNKETALSKIRELLDSRAKSQPTGDATCGSVFKNPEGNFSARLIENLGLKGYTLGGAHVSTKHANFIVNQGDAKSQDIEDLIQFIAHKVEAHYGIRLVPEVHFIGEKDTK